MCVHVCVCARRIVVHGEPFLRAIKPFSAKVFDLGAEFKMSRSEVTDHMTPHIYWSHLIGLIKHNHSLPEAFGSVRVCYSLYIVIVPAQQDKHCCLSSVWVMIIC